ncbi:MobA/MobL family protein [Acinetobacter baumannii]|uniref:MobA/MobL family protein n=1 Tax=Acinetobacter TaxID=469 RepID=UPI0015D1C3BA|nr:MULTISPECIES: MobA/MobL family protein [Acinetobacter]EHU1450972.1 MobA/MobL family protein [Acinetobacter baumannii]EHU1749261.1 MobA/MobL family protein [Acinetobacter baumannii]EHU1802134.1 MobA/MobL family protein [Acinetobacter baumannii]EHU1953059.1 MobA/MobL family protein [Acinetobacter baumannii]EHU2404441.1 MobA/MobL family protein [Acinetobacter baumannii]
MFYFDLRHNRKQSSKSSFNGYCYITRIKHFKLNKIDLNEEVEFVCSGNMPGWAEYKPDKFWIAADKYEKKNSRTSSHITIALPKELNAEQRIELSKNLINAFCDEFKFPYSCAIHNHKGILDGESDQPHLHLQYSERTTLDDFERPPELFFRQYRPKNPERGGAQKITADVLGLGKDQIKKYRELTEKLINGTLEKYAPMKTVRIYDIEVQVPSQVSCLSNANYNQKFGTKLKDVPQIERWKLYSADPIIQMDVKPLIEKVKKIREENLYELYKNEYELELKRIHKMKAEINKAKVKNHDADCGMSM